MMIYFVPLRVLGGPNSHSAISLQPLAFSPISPSLHVTP